MLRESAKDELRRGLLLRLLGRRGGEPFSGDRDRLCRDERLQEVTAGTVCRELHHIQHAISIAMREWGYPLDENPAEKVRKPKLNNARNRRVSQSEIERLIAELAEIDRQDVIAVINFAVETGMRRGEILTLEWRFVETSTLDLEMGEIIRFRAINRWDEDDEFDDEEEFTDEDDLMDAQMAGGGIWPFF